MRRDGAPMEAGDRDRYVAIETKTPTKDASGFPTTTAATLATVWMSHAAKGSERFIADQDSAKADGLWEMGYHADMDPELVDVPNLRQLRYPASGGRTYDIVAASLIGQHEGVRILTLSKNG